MKFKIRHGEFEQGCVLSESYTATDVLQPIVPACRQPLLPACVFVTRDTFRHPRRFFSGNLFVMTGVLEPRFHCISNIVWPLRLNNNKDSKHASPIAHSQPVKVRTCTDMLGQKTQLHPKKVAWRESPIPGQKNVVNNPSIKLEKNYTPPSHIELGLVKHFVSATDQNSDEFMYMKNKFPRISYIEIRERVFDLIQESWYRM
jgi:hypothetical protein